ncbi:hypothetical protein O6P37_15945 [Mycobacterium sp. CPCC 205372]|uniref:Lipoprotein n=1 Tax=Mycobacterium hippophais TaxID=3016340 RepID=A0ABT4PV34_9MYCO|nr:hypothetical protein [Mycobacterium hippophais]MCZ8380361.1 hypothetical protein [Mycobacterium hippophais]
MGPIAIVLASGFLAGCSSSSTTDEQSSSSERPVPPPPSAAAPPVGTVVPTTEGTTAYAEQVQTMVLDGLSDNDLKRPATFRDMCATIVVWACAIAKIESDSPGTIEITLAPEDLWIAKWDGSTDWYDFGEHVARGVYNFAGGVQPPISQIDVMTPTGDIAYLGNY